MYAKMTEIELLQEANNVRDFVIVKGYDEASLFKLGESLKKEKDVITNIYWLNAADTKMYESFSSIRIPARFVIQAGSLRASTGGLIFPQSEPIILIFDNFGLLNDEESARFVNSICKKESHDYFPHLYLHEDSIVILSLNKDEQEPKISYKLEVRSIA
jgi:hypothetical protein